MANIRKDIHDLREVTFPKTPREPKGGYLWTEWFNGKTWQLDKDVDFVQECAAFDRVVRNAANDFGILVTVKALPGYTGVLIQARNSDGSPLTGPPALAVEKAARANGKSTPKEEAPAPPPATTFAGIPGLG